jgi:zinc protease
MKDSKTLKIAMLAMTALPMSMTMTAIAGPDETKAEMTEAPSMDAKAKKVWDRSIEVTMSENAEDEWVESVRLVGTMSIPSQMITANMNVLIAPKRGFRAVVELPGLGQFESGVSGDVAWSNDMMNGPRVLDGEEAKQAFREMDLYADLHWDQYYSSISYKGEETVTLPDDSEVKTHALELVDIEDGETSTRWYSAETGYVVKTETTAVGPGGAPIPSTTYTMDYREVNGIMMPYKTISNSGPIQQVMEFTEIQVNGEVSDEELSLPEDIKELVDG